MSWLLLMTLWLPLVDHGLSHGPQSRAVLAAVNEPQRCVLVDRLTSAQLHALRLHTPLKLQHLHGKSAPTDCQTLLVSPSAHSTLHQRVNLAQWTYTSSVKRLGRTRDDILVYSRNPESSR